MQITFQPQTIQNYKNADKMPASTIMLVNQLGKNMELPNTSRNHCNFNQPLVQAIVAQREVAIPYLTNFLGTIQDEKQIVEGLYTLDRMIDEKVKGAENLYPVISRFNNTPSPNIQVMLAGIYRKTQVPDAFGPLNKMMMKQTFYPNSPYFDPTEEIGGAILEYLRNQNAKTLYSQANK